MGTSAAPVLQHRINVPVLGHRNSPSHLHERRMLQTRPSAEAKQLEQAMQQCPTRGRSYSVLSHHIYHSFKFFTVSTSSFTDWHHVRLLRRAVEGSTGTVPLLGDYHGTDTEGTADTYKPEGEL